MTVTFTRYVLAQYGGSNKPRPVTNETMLARLVISAVRFVTGWVRNSISSLAGHALTRSISGYEKFFTPKGIAISQPERRIG